MLLNTEVEQMPIQVMNNFLLGLSKLLVNEIGSVVDIDNKNLFYDDLPVNQNEQRIVH